MKPCLLHAGRYEKGICYSKRNGTKRANVARQAYEEYNFLQLTSGQKVYRHCKNSKCVEPEHLYASKGLHYKAYTDFDYPVRKGEANVNVKITEEIVLDIRARHLKGVTNVDMAEEYGLSRTHVGRIVRGVAWKHI